MSIFSQERKFSNRLSSSYLASIQNNVVYCALNIKGIIKPRATSARLILFETYYSPVLFHRPQYQS